MDDRARIVENETLAPYFFRKTKKSNEEKLKPYRPSGDLATRTGRPLRPVILLVLAALIGLSTYHFLTTDRAPAGGPSRDAGAQPVGAATIALGDINVIIGGLGTVTPLANVTVKSQVNGQLLEVGFKEGQIIKKGDFLAQIDPRPFQLAASQYEGQLIHDQGLLEQAQADMKRYETLVKQNSIARQTAEDQVFLARQYEGSVKTDQAQIDAQKLNLTYAHIVSPIDGRVGLRLVDAGNYVQTTDAGIAILTQLQPISVIFIVPEDNIPSIMEQLKAGAPLEVTIYDRANIHELATSNVMTIDNQIDTTRGTAKIRAQFDNFEDKLFPNQFVNVQLRIKSLHGVVAAPLTAIQRGPRGTYVYLIGSDNTVSEHNVELGPQDNSKIAVISGLAAGDRVVVDGADRLRNGAKVFIAASDGVPAREPAPGHPGGKGTDKERGGHHRHNGTDESGPSQAAPGAPGVR